VTLFVVCCKANFTNLSRYGEYSERTYRRQYQKLGRPQARCRLISGVIEGACRHLVNDRMDITGARWRLDRAEAVLQIRALRSSGDFDEYWYFHKLQEFTRNHVDKFLNPDLLIPA
jgi:hypothetical protein